HEEEGRTLREERVARIYHGNVATQKAVEEFKVISGLSGAGFPVPEVFHLETDASLLCGPFIIMERVRGKSLSEAYHTSDEEEARNLMAEFTRIWVDLHNLDGASLFPEDFPRGDTQDYLDELLVLANRRIEEAGIGWLQPVLDWLEERRSDVTPERLSILHQDYHTENVMLRDDGSLVVLDWTAAMAGDYRADLAWTVLLMSTYDDPAFREIILKSYEEASDREIRDIEFFDVLAIGRRILDVSSSFAAGAEQAGMRAGALEMMRKSSDHLHKVYELLKERTGLRLPEFEDLLRTL
ncbi:MAG: phosphotransferase family protein, partial [Candidatus Bathyarchaeota archaeon]|nr:phosphotransferase family protein [Candidatus Bathyarchaeota archaeon]